jgi:hypothetical protein
MINIKRKMFPQQQVLRTDPRENGTAAQQQTDIQTNFGLDLPPQGPTIVGTGNGTPKVPKLPSAWEYSWATLSPGVINTER